MRALPDPFLTQPQTTSFCKNGCGRAATQPTIALLFGSTALLWRQFNRQRRAGNVLSLCFVGFVSCFTGALTTSKVYVVSSITHHPANKEGPHVCLCESRKIAITANAACAVKFNVRRVVGVYF